MKIKEVTASIRKSRNLNNKGWDTMELAATASVSSTEDWKEEQKKLYTELEAQLTVMWAISRE